jgi:hypothetical protein
MTVMHSAPLQALSGNAATVEPARCETDAKSPRFMAGRECGELLIALAVFACALLYLWPLRDFLSFNADEGITLASAERILRGQVPYRDFFTFVTPGSPYLMALWFKLFGTSFTVARSVLLVFAGVFGALTYQLARRIGSRSSALLAAALLVFGCLPSRFFVLHNWDSTIFALLAIYCAQSLLDKPSRAFSCLLGCTTALTFLTEQSKGAGLVLGLGIAALALILPRRSRYHAPIGNLCSGAAGFAIPLALTFAYFASQHATKAMLEAWFWPLRHYSAVNRLAYGTVPMSAQDIRDLYATTSWALRALVLTFSAPMFLISALALLVFASTFYAVAIRRSAAPSRALEVRVLGGCIFAGVFLSTLATGRADLNHLIYLTPLFMYLVPSVLDIDHHGSPLFRETRPVIACLLLFSFVGFGMVTLLKAVAPAAKTETRRGMVRLAYPDEVLAYVQHNVTAGQHLYVHPYQASYSFMTATVNPTRMNFLQPGMNTADQYEMTIADLAADRPPFVLFDPNLADKISSVWPSTPAEDLAKDPVADYILQHYRTCRFLNSNPPQLWSFYYMVRKDLSCPENRGASSEPDR